MLGTVRTSKFLVQLQRMVEVEKIVIVVTKWRLYCFFPQQTDAETDALQKVHDALRPFSASAYAGGFDAIFMKRALCLCGENGALTCGGLERAVLIKSDHEEACNCSCKNRKFLRNVLGMLKFGGVFLTYDPKTTIEHENDVAAAQADGSQGSVSPLTGRRYTSHSQIHLAHILRTLHTNLSSAVIRTDARPSGRKR